MKLGVLVNMNIDTLEGEFKKLKGLGFDSCQLCCWDAEQYNEKNARIIKELLIRYNVQISAFWCGWDGPCEWNFIQGPITIGLVPAAYRYKRLDILKKCSDFISRIGINDLVTHVGFIPNNPYDPDYTGLIGALRDLASHCRKNGQYFLFETGQEAPVTLIRTIEDIGADNVGINLDPANLLMYGYGNPIDALELFGKYIRNVHGKDGLYPQNGKVLGEEMPLGKGKVNYPVLIGKLKEIGYDRYITIEREINGEKQTKDIIAAKELLETLI